MLHTVAGRRRWSPPALRQLGGVDHVEPRGLGQPHRAEVVHRLRVHLRVVADQAAERRRRRRRGSPGRHRADQPAEGPLVARRRAGRLRAEARSGSPRDCPRAVQRGRRGAGVDSRCPRRDDVDPCPRPSRSSRRREALALRATRARMVRGDRYDQSARHGALAAGDRPQGPPDRNLALELVRVTEAAAMAAGRWVGRGDKNGADARRRQRDAGDDLGVSMSGTVVIGEGEKDDAPMLYNGEEVGDGTGPQCDVAVDPIDGTTLTAKGMSNAIAVLAVAPRGSMYDPSAVFYMEKLVAGPEAADVVDIRYPWRRTSTRSPRPRAPTPRTSPSCCSTGPATSSSSTRSARPAPGSSSSSTATSPARSWPPCPTPASTCCSASAAPRRASSPPAR